ncbi:MAG: aminopeptidase P family protein [Alphaproteobacteria bacterium]|nr:aminopeptidase P family protein [Alphaproteobacteria bacterium]MDE2267255.1 aminopeptidase P family protein [Alphaproteobacteria bacterium]
MTHGIGGSSAGEELASIKPLAGRPPTMQPSVFEERLERVRGLMHAAGADALLVGAGANLRYFANVGWEATERLVAMVVPRNGRPIIVCPTFELSSLHASLAIEGDIRSWQEDESPAALVGHALREVDADTLALDPALPFGVFHALREIAPSLAVINATALIDACRSVKSSSELTCLSYAKSLTLAVHRAAARILHDGITTGELRTFIDAMHRKMGADGGSTFCAVQFGQATAYPHGIPGEQTLHENELVLIDTGCQILGYHSDITRTYIFGEPSPEQRRVWDIEHEAQAAAFAAVRPGIQCEAIDRAARDVLERHGFGPGFVTPGLPHRTGHGIGLSIHEAPYLVPGDRTSLLPGMCFSNEPMIVVPGRFGIRLEDHFHVTESGAAWFTQPSPSIDAPFG